MTLDHIAMKASDKAHVIVAAVALTIAGSLIAAVAYHGLEALAQWSAR